MPTIDVGCNVTDDADKVCGIPPRPATPQGSFTEYPICPEEVCGATPIPAPPVSPDPLTPCSPCSKPPELPADCCWEGEIHDSIPPAVPCAPVNVGWGQWDGGFQYWAMQSGDEEYKRLQECDSLIRREYSQWNWHHILDLTQHDRHHADLMVRRDGIPKDISLMEFLTLATRMAQLAVLVGAVPPPMVPSQMGIKVVRVGTDGSGRPTFGLAQTYGGAPIGTPLPLTTQYDATGEPVMVSFGSAGLTP